MPKSNVRFVAIWAAFVPVVLVAVAIVGAPEFANWSATRVTFVTGEVNAASALVLAAVAYLWAHSVKEPAALQGAVSAFAVTTLALGTSFGWWSLSDSTTQLVVLGVGLVLVLVLTIFNRSVAYAPETVEMEKAKAQTPAAVFGAVADRLKPPASEAGESLAVVVVVCGFVLVVLLLLHHWGVV